MENKLTGIYLNKFQSILGPTLINLEKLTFLYGPNSAGKSAIIDAIKLIEDIVSKKDGVRSLINKNSRVNSSSTVGVEFIAGEVEEDDNIDWKKWLDTKDSAGETSHQIFHDKLKGHRVQIEFEGWANIKIAIDGCPLLELDGYKSTYYNELHKLDISEHPESDECIFGRLKLFKKNQWLDLLEDYIDSFYVKSSNRRKNGWVYRPLYDAYHFGLFVQEDHDNLLINGIDYRGDYGNDSHISVAPEIESLLFYTFGNKSEKESGLTAEVYKFRRSHFNKSSTRYKKEEAKRVSLYWHYHDLAKNINLVIDGFLLKIKAAIKYSHVRGDRGLLNSEKPFFVSGYEKISKVVSNGVTCNHLSEYADFLNRSKKKGFEGVDYFRPKPMIKGDFVNHSLGKLLPSLSQYTVSAEEHLLRSPLDYNKKKYQTEKIVFLNVEDKNGKVLGFQDVGSGVSYVLPILTSLWQSSFSIIEQPELHLHPQAQCELGDIFISAYARGSAALVESHSEHLLLRMLRRIRETTSGSLVDKELELKPGDITIYYFEPIPEGHTVVRKIRVDRHGELLDLWPGGFFSERDSELFP